MSDLIEPKLIAPDHRMKITYPGGITRDVFRQQVQEALNWLGKKGCTFWQLDENDEQTVVLVSGWLKQPRLPDVHYVDRSELVINEAAE
jgi:hypothetical protein